MIIAADFASSQTPVSSHTSAQGENQLKVIACLIASSRDTPLGHVRSPERRHCRRIPYTRILSVTPATSEGQPATGESLVAFGKQISFRGLDFYHREPLTHRHVIVSAIGPDEAETTMLLELTRCQFMADGRYVSGGRFLSVMMQSEDNNSKTPELPTFHGTSE